MSVPTRSRAVLAITLPLFAACAALAVGGAIRARAASLNAARVSRGLLLGNLTVGGNVVTQGPYADPTLSRFTCNNGAVAAATQCQAAPAAGLSIYVTDMVLNAGAAISTISVTTGTGANCGTGTTTVAGGYALPIDGTTSIGLQSPIKLPAAQALCCSPTASSTCTFSGFIGP
jgi:hypothetical protein